MFHESRLVHYFREMPQSAPQQDEVLPANQEPQSDTERRLEDGRRRFQERKDAEERARQQQRELQQQLPPLPGIETLPANTPATLELGPTEQARVIIPGINPPILVHRNFVRTQNDPSGRIKFNVERKRNGDKYTVTASASVAGMKIEKV